MIVAIEFDYEQFKTIEKCTEWLTSNSRDWYLKIQGFRLRLRKDPRYLTYESRKVFSYYSDQWKYPNLKLSRPDPYVVVLEKSGTEIYQIGDLPPLLPQTIRKVAQMEEAKVEKKKKQREYRERKKNEPKESKKRKTSNKEKDGLTEENALGVLSSELDTSELETMTEAASQIPDF